MRRWRPSKASSQNNSSAKSPKAQQQSISAFFKPQPASDAPKSATKSLKRPRDEALADLSADGSPERICHEVTDVPRVTSSDPDSINQAQEPSTPIVTTEALSDHAKQRLRNKAQQKFAQDACVTSASSKPTQPYTPLEKQVAELKRRHPDMLLFVEVTEAAPDIRVFKLPHALSPSLWLLSQT